MASLREQLIHVLDVDPPHGLMAWVRSTPLQQALKIVRGREKEALHELEGILGETDQTLRLHINAVPLLSHLYVATAVIPSAGEIYRARLNGQTFDPHLQLKQAMQKLLGSNDLEVRVAAAVELLRVANPADLPALRLQLADLLPVLRGRRFEDPMVHQALLDLGGQVDILAWVNELAAHPGAMPPHLEALLLALEREPHEAAAPQLVRIFPKLDAIAEKRDPVRQDIGGVRAWDGYTTQAALLLRVYLQLVPIAEIAPSVELLRAPTPKMAAVLLTETASLGERAVLLASAAARDATLPDEVRGAGLATLVNIVQTPGSPAKMSAIEHVQRLRDDPAMGALAIRALANIEAAKS